MDDLKEVAKTDEAAVSYASNSSLKKSSKLEKILLTMVITVAAVYSILFRHALRDPSHEVIKGKPADGKDVDDSGSN